MDDVAQEIALRNNPTANTLHFSRLVDSALWYYMCGSHCGENVARPRVTRLPAGLIACILRCCAGYKP